MTTASARLGLVKPTTADPFNTQDLANNWQKVDDHPGAKIVTSSTRPAWGVAQNGMMITETDTGLRWQWNGTTFIRAGGNGLLKRQDGTWALAQRITDFTTSSPLTRVVVGMSNVVVPAGRRPLKVEVQIPQTSTDQFLGWLYQSNVNDSGLVLQKFRLAGSSGTQSVLIPDGLVAGNYDFSFQISLASYWGQTTSATVVCNSTYYYCEIRVTEL